ncbi:MAG: cysteine--tRNA ligase [Dehalococcoidia bacterium]
MRIHDTLSDEKVELEPLDGERVRLYVCGVTPYSQSHVGHALKSVVFDVLRRYLEWRGFAVHHVENFTDIDDKLIERAAALGITVSELAEQNIDDYLRNLERMNVLPATSYPRVSEKLPEIIRFIEGLIERDFAYVSEGDVYYRVRKKPDYGKLSHRNIDDLKSGARIDPSERKDDPLDFALWKAAKPGEPSWPSPWGPGRPGWHIECSAMALAELGEQLDIHGGGADLIFPHHENEIAQSEAYTGKSPFARIWMHNALLRFGAEKMSKSLGNVVTIGEALDKHGPDAFRMFVLSSHYRSPVTYSDEALESARAGAERLRAAAFAQNPAGQTEAAIDGVAARERFIQVMDDDLNTPQAVAVLFDLAREINRGRDAGCDIRPAQATLRELAGVLGFTLAAPPAHGREAAPFIDLLVRVRSELRAKKEWALADSIRDGLAGLGVELKDGPTGTEWSAR